MQFVAAGGPVPVGGYLQYTTLLRNNASSSGNANVTLSVTCSGKLPYLSKQFSCRCTGIGLLELVLLML
jgi:hypothetical protein